MFNWNVLIIMLLKSIFIYIYKILCGFYYYLMVYCYNIWNDWYICNYEYLCCINSICIIVNVFVYFIIMVVEKVSVKLKI